jgi:hypothetical protein
MWGVLTMPVTKLHAQQQTTGNGRALQAFMLTTTYGVIAGTLTGLASLAFYEKPGDHSRNIAMGASLGLYVGILLGAYVVYAPALKSSPSSTPGEDTNPDDPINLNSSLRGPSALPLVNWDPKNGGQLGFVYNF